MQQEIYALLTRGAGFYWGLLLVTGLVWVILDGAGILGPRRIRGIPSVRGFPIVGNLFQLRGSSSLQYSSWTREYGDVFQVRMGMHRFLVVNLFAGVKHFWIKHLCANNSRPVLYTFHQIVSKTQGLTIGSTPQSPRYKAMRKVVATAFNKRNVTVGSETIDLETARTVAQIPEGQVDLMGPFQRFALRVSIHAAYGVMLDTEGKDALLANEIISTENKIINLRSQTSNLEDYLWIFRVLKLSLGASQAAMYRDRRDAYMNRFLAELKERIATGTHHPCLVSQCLTQPNPDLTEAELKSICLTLVSAGLDNTPYTLNHCMGHLSQPETGLQQQHEALTFLVEAYGSLSAAWALAPSTLTCDYVVALLNETLRYFTVLPLALPRATTKPIVYLNTVIPAGTFLIMNAYHANHDPMHFDNPHRFDPHRFLDSNHKLHFRESEGTLHFGFGAGSRGCSGKHLAFQEMYALLVRTLIMFTVSPPTNPAHLMLLDPFAMNGRAGAVSFEPRSFRYTLKKRVHPFSYGSATHEGERPHDG